MVVGGEAMIPDFKFRIDRKCSKCGYEGRWMVDGPAKVIRAAAEVKWIRDQNDEEYLLRTCKRCGYQWKEACIDA